MIVVLLWMIVVVFFCVFVFIDFFYFVVLFVVLGLCFGVYFVLFFVVMVDLVGFENLFGVMGFIMLVYGFFFIIGNLIFGNYLIY